MNTFVVNKEDWLGLLGIVENLMALDSKLATQVYEAQMEIVRLNKRLEALERATNANI